MIVIIILLLLIISLYVIYSMQNPIKKTNKLMNNVVDNGHIDKTLKTVIDTHKSNMNKHNNTSDVSATELFDIYNNFEAFDDMSDEDVLQEFNGKVSNETMNQFVEDIKLKTHIPIIEPIRIINNPITINGNDYKVIPVKPKETIRDKLLHKKYINPNVRRFIDKQHNSHDSGINASSRINIKHLMELNDTRIPFNIAIKECIQACENKNLLNDDIIKVTNKIIDSSGKIITYNNLSEHDIFSLVWSRINHQDNSKIRDNLIENLAKQLNNSVEHNMTVCKVGRVNRLLNTLVGADVSDKFHSIPMDMMIESMKEKIVAAIMKAREIPVENKMDDSDIETNDEIIVNAEDAPTIVNNDIGPVEKIDKRSIAAIKSIKEIVDEYSDTLGPLRANNIADVYIAEILED